MIINTIIMNKFFRYTSQFLESFDMFPTSQFIRYKSSGDYKTSTGGFISISIIIIFVILFYRLGIQTANQQIIYASTSTTIQLLPQPVTISMKKGSDFMFSVGIQYLDLSNTSKKYFNITLSQRHYGPLLSGTNFTTIPLVPCTPDHFSYNPEILNFYYKFHLFTNLCPPLNYDLTVSGRVIANLYQSINVNIQYCNKSIDSTCATDDEVQKEQTKLGGFAAYFPVISTVVNAGDADYKQTYMQQRNLYYFTTKSGLWMNAKIQQYQIDTDISLLPTTNIQSQLITTVPNLFQVKPKTVYGGQYVEVVFDKSERFTTFTRSFNKIDDYLSYVGGLVGTFIMLFFILSSYSQKAYTISIASDIYHLQEDQSKPKSFNFLYFISISIKKLFKLVKVQLQWQQSNKFEKAMEEMEKQLDIAYLLRRINYFQEAIASILNQHQIKILHMNDKKYIKAAATQRKSSKSQKIFKKSSKLQNQADFQIKSENENNESRGSFTALQSFQRQHNLQIVNEQSQSDKSSQHQQKDVKYTNSLAQIIQESKEGNTVSRRILQRASKKIYPQIQILTEKSNPRKQQWKQQIIKEESQQKKDTFIPFEFVQDN